MPKSAEFEHLLMVWPGDYLGIVTDDRGIGFAVPALLLLDGDVGTPKYRPGVLQVAPRAGEGSFSSIPAFRLQAIYGRILVIPVAVIAACLVSALFSFVRYSEECGGPFHSDSNPFCAPAIWDDSVVVLAFLVALAAVCVMILLRTVMGIDPRARIEAKIDIPEQLIEALRDLQRRLFRVESAPKREEEPPPTLGGKAKRAAIRASLGTLGHMLGELGETGAEAILEANSDKAHKIRKALLAARVRARAAETIIASHWEWTEREPIAVNKDDFMARPAITSSQFRSPPPFFGDAGDHSLIEGGMP